MYLGREIGRRAGEDGVRGDERGVAEAPTHPNKSSFNVGLGQYGYGSRVMLWGQCSTPTLEVDYYVK